MRRRHDGLPGAPAEAVIALSIVRVTLARIASSKTPSSSAALAQPNHGDHVG